MDLFAPLLHEFTYQAMVQDLLPLREGSNTYYRMPNSRNDDAHEGKEMELSETDDVWVKYRHLHMKDLLEEIVKDFAAFKAKNPQFAERFVRSFKPFQIYRKESLINSTISQR